MISEDTSHWLDLDDITLEARSELAACSQGCDKSHARRRQSGAPSSLLSARSQTSCLEQVLLPNQVSAPSSFVVLEANPIQTGRPLQLLMSWTGRVRITLRTSN